MFYMEIPPLRLPQPRNVLVKTLTRMQWYFIEIFPLFILASVLLWAGKLSGALDVAGPHRCIRRWRLWGCRRDTAAVFILGFFRRDFGAAGLYDLQAKGLLTPVQLTVAAVTLTLFVPCVAQFLMMKKERGWKVSLAIFGFVTAVAFGFGWLLNRRSSSPGCCHEVRILRPGDPRAAPRRPQTRCGACPGGCRKVHCPYCGYANPAPSRISETARHPKKSDDQGVSHDHFRTKPRRSSKRSGSPPRRRASTLPCSKPSESAPTTKAWSNCNRLAFIDIQGERVYLREEGRDEAQMTVRRHRLAERLTMDIFDLQGRRGECQGLRIRAPAARRRRHQTLHPAQPPHHLSPRAADSPGALLPRCQARRARRGWSP